MMHYEQGSAGEPLASTPADVLVRLASRDGLP